jgi:hypothetical protein
MATRDSQMDPICTVTPSLFVFFLDVAATDRIDAVREEQPHNPTKKMMFKDTPNQI